MRVALFGVLALVISAACSLGSAEPASLFDAAPAYPGYAWTRDGHTVSPEELGTIAGPRHCGCQPATFLNIGSPPGTHSSAAAQVSTSAIRRASHRRSFATPSNCTQLCRAMLVQRGTSSKA